MREFDEYIVLGEPGQREILGNGNLPKCNRRQFKEQYLHLSSAAMVVATDGGKSKEINNIFDEAV